MRVRRLVRVDEMHERCFGRDLERRNYQGLLSSCVFQNLFRKFNKKTDQTDRVLYSRQRRVQNAMLTHLKVPNDRVTFAAQKY